MTHPPLDSDRCCDLWGAVFERALRDAWIYIRPQPNRYWYSLYLQQQRKRRSKITPYRKWAQDRRSQIKKMELRRDEALAWMDSEDFGVCCDLVGADVEALRLRLWEMVNA